jgi:hypothetical protein
MGQTARHIKRFVISLFCIGILFAVFSFKPMHKQAAKEKIPAPVDTIVKFAKRYVSYMDNLGSKGGAYKKTFAKKLNHEKYIPVYNGAWPDSMEETVNVVYYKGEPVVYEEIPVNAGNIYLETGWYFYNGKLIAKKVTIQDFKSACTFDHGLETIKSFSVYDTTAAAIANEVTMVDSKNQPIDSNKCTLKPTSICTYKTFADTPFAKMGVWKK